MAARAGVWGQTAVIFGRDFNVFEQTKAV